MSSLEYSSLHRGTPRKPKGSGSLPDRESSSASSAPITSSSNGIPSPVSSERQIKKVSPARTPLGTPTSRPTVPSPATSRSSGRTTRSAGGWGRPTAPPISRDYQEPSGWISPDDAYRLWETTGACGDEPSLPTSILIPGARARSCALRSMRNGRDMRSGLPSPRLPSGIAPAKASGPT